MFQNDDGCRRHPRPLDAGRILVIMGRSIIDGDRWIRERLVFLRARLGEDLGEAERTAIEVEITALSAERGIGPAGHSLVWPLRWFRRRR